MGFAAFLLSMISFSDDGNDGSQSDKIPMSEGGQQGAEGYYGFALQHWGFGFSVGDDAPALSTRVLLAAFTDFAAWLG